MIDTESYRVRIGCYSHGRSKAKWKPDTIVIGRDKVSLSIRVFLFALLSVIGGVETHPGPTRLEDRVIELEENLSKLQVKCKLLIDACLTLEQRCEELEGQSRRSNLIIHNLPPKDNGTEMWEESEQKARDYFTSIGINKDVKIERAHRLSKGNKNSPVIVKMSFFQEKEEILAKAKDLRKEKKRRKEEIGENDVFVNPDYTHCVRRARAALRPHLMDAIQNDKRAYLSYDKLVIQGKTFWAAEDMKSLTDKKPKVMSASELKSKLNMTE